MGAGLGIHEDILDAASGAITPQELGAALGCYAGSKGYLRAMREGAARIGLDGLQTGLVSAEEAKDAREKLEAIWAKQSARLRARAAQECAQAEKAAKAPSAPEVQATSPSPRRPVLRMPTQGNRDVQRQQ